MRVIRFLLLAIITLAFTFPPADVKLEYAFKVGDEYLWTQTTKQSIKQSVMGMEQNTENQYEGEFKLRILALTASGAKIEANFTKLKNTATTPMGEMSMTSEGESDKTEDKVFKAMLNKPFFVLMNKNGQVESVENAENLFSGLKDIGLDENTAAMMKQSMEQLLGKDALKGSFEQAFVVYPDKKVKKGDTWSANSAAPLNFPLKIENTWNLQTISGSTAGLTADGIYTTTDKDKEIHLPQGLKAKVDLSGKQAMKTSVDVKTGWPTTLDVLSEIKGTMTLLAGGMIPEDMNIPMEILTETSYKITKK